MPITQKIERLLSYKYRSNIAVVTNDQRPKVVVMTDTDSGAMFWTVDDTMFTFKDKHNNIWATPPDSVFVGKEQFHPKMGDHFTGPDGETCIFTTKEKIVELAFRYFMKYVEISHGLAYTMSICYFKDNHNTEDPGYKLNFKRFKYSASKGEKVYISFN